MIDRFYSYYFYAIVVACLRAVKKVYVSPPLLMCVRVWAYVCVSCVHGPDRLHCDKALCNFLVFVDYLIDIFCHFNFNATDILVIMNSPSWYGFCAVLPPKICAVGFLSFVKAVLLLSLLPCMPLDQVFATAVCGGCLPYRYRTVYHVPPFSTQHSPSFCVSLSSCQHFSHLENDSCLCDRTAKVSMFLTRQQQLLSFDPGTKPCLLDPDILSCLKDLGIAYNLPRKRSKRGGRRKPEDSCPYYLPQQMLVCTKCLMSCWLSPLSLFSRPQLVG